MKYFFRTTIPSVHDVLLIESGSPKVVERSLGGVRRIFPGARYHLLTCQADASSRPFDTVFRSSDYPSWWSKLLLLLSFRKKGYEVVAVLCTKERILWRWKMLALAVIPAKVLIINENADFFWLHWRNWRTFRQLVSVRWGMAAKLRALCSGALHALLFPFLLLFLISNAAFLYARRWGRLALWKAKRSV
ncbi:MAG: hypothetical protein HY648_14125 [Acidobacteria bacterium]|nr:hypothetical protein [Acidobacteriota bacterium]